MKNNSSGHDGIGDAIPMSVDPSLEFRSTLLWLVEERLKLPSGTIIGVNEEPTDWAFVAKLALIVEAALTEYLVLELGRPEVFKDISMMDQSKRLLLARSLGVLEDDERKVLQVLLEVRNDFAHRLENMSRSLSGYVENLSLARRNQLVQILISDETRGSLKAQGQDAVEVLPGVFRWLLLQMTVLPLITMSLKHGKKEHDRRLETQGTQRKSCSFTETLSPSPEDGINSHANKSAPF